MSAYYWSKLPHSFFDDRLIDSLDADLYKIYFKLFMLAGIENGATKTGELPDFETIVYRLRCWNDEQLETAMGELENKRLLSRVDGVWSVRDYGSIQAPEDAKERKRQERKRKAQELNSVTFRDTEEKRREKKRREVEENADSTSDTTSFSFPVNDDLDYITDLAQRFIKEYKTKHNNDIDLEESKHAVALWLAEVDRRHAKGKNYSDYVFDFILERLVEFRKQAVTVSRYTPVE